MDFASKLKAPKMDLAGAAEAMKGMTKLGTHLQTIGKELGDIAGALTGVGNVVPEISGGNTSASTFQTLNGHVEEINSSQDEVMKNVDEVKAILEDLGKVAGPANDDKPGKVRRVVDATMDLLKLVTKILEKLVGAIESVQSLEGGGGDVAETCKSVVLSIKEFGQNLIEVKDCVGEIINIVKGNEGKGGAAKNNGKKGKEEKQGESLSKEKGKSEGTEKEKIEGKESEEEGGCWSSLKSCFCCCCN